MPVQKGLFDESSPAYALPVNYEPVRPDYFQVSRIYLAKGSLDPPERRIFVEKICRLYPEAKSKNVLILRITASH
jgi:hypothetical protein